MKYSKKKIVGIAFLILIGIVVGTLALATQVPDYKDPQELYWALEDNEVKEGHYATLTVLDIQPNEKFGYEIKVGDNLYVVTRELPEDLSMFDTIHIKISGGKRYFETFWVLKYSYIRVEKE